MRWWQRAKWRLQVVFNKKAAEMELDDEIRFHLEQEIRQHIDAGVDPVEARRRALVDFGGVERFKEQVRDVRGARVVDDFVQDSRIALRSLRKQPGFLLSVLLTLGIGIGGNVAMFGVLERSLFQTLPYQNSEDLVLGRVTYEGEVGFTVSGPDFFDHRDGAASFETMAALTPFTVTTTVTGGRDPERITAPFASIDFFETFGVSPAAGRYFLPEEGEAGGAAVAVLSHSYWQRNYAGDHDVVGSAITVDGLPTTVVGIAPAGFRFFMDADMWRPIQRNAGWAEARQFHNFVIVGRLAEGVSVEVAQAEADVIGRRLEEAYPDTNRGKGLNITPLRRALSEQYTQALNILAAAVAVLLVIACANVSGLLLARGSARRSEMAVRAAMGAGRGRLARQLLTENVYLALGAGAVGLLLATWIQRGILTFMPMDTLGNIGEGLSASTLAFALSVTAATLLLFGLVPSLRVAGGETGLDLRAGGRGSVGDRRTGFRNGLVVAQVAMTAVLLTVSGLLFRSFQELTHVDAGFDTGSLMTAEVSIPRGVYGGDPQAGTLFYSQLLDRVSEIPGVSSVAATSHLPIQNPGGNIRVALPEDFGNEGVFGTLAYRRSVLPGYFDALGIPLIRGRDVQRSDVADAPSAIVLSEALAGQLFGDTDPVGRTVGVDHGGPEPALREVIGVVGDVVTGSLGEGRDFAMYYPYYQSPSTQMRLAVRGQSDLTGIATAIRDVLRELDPNVPLNDVTTMEQVVAASVAGERTIAIVLVLFASIALLLAGVGLYGTLAYQVSRRVHEIGVRMALGASASSVTRGIVRGGLRLVVLGILLGVPGALLAGRLVRGMLFGVQPTDPTTLVAVTVFLVSVAVAACLLPARRAARINPADAFRSE